MLYLLNKDVRTVRWNGEPLHEATSAIVKETMNGDFTLTVKYPISDSGIYQLIQEDMLIKALTPVLGAQLFRIKKPVENNDHLEITAYHISDDVMQRSITPMNVTSQSCGMALSRMVQNTKTALGDFSFNSDIQDRRTFNTTETETLYSVLLDGKHSIVGTWEGELVRDNFALTVKKSRGENRGVVITTHKNLKDYQRTRNSQNVVTRIHAKSTFKPEGAEKETTIRVTVDSPLINSYPYINEKEYENNNAKTVEELQKWAQAKFTNEGIDKVSDAIKIEAFELDGQVVHMGDTVNLKSWKHNVDSFKKAIAYEFDALKEEYISLTFDDKAGTGGSRASGGLSSAADAILGVTESAQEIALEKALQNADLGFDHQAGLLRQEIADGIELARAKAEEVKQELSDTIDQRFSSFDNGPLQEIKRKAIEALQNAGASTLLAQEAKRIGLDSVAKLEEFRKQATSAQTALSGDLDVLKRTIANDIRPKQAQAEAEIAKQVEALVQTKKELAGVKSAQATYEETTTRRLSELTNLANGKASKSELTQTAEELASKIASVRVGGRNHYRDSEKVRTSTRFFPFPLHPYLTQENVGETWTLSFDLKINEGGEIRPLHFYHYQTNRFGLKASADITPSKDWQRFTFTGPVIFPNDDPRYSRGEMALYDYGGNNNYSVRRIKLEKGNVATDWSPAIEDTDGKISAVESNFRQRADALDAGVRSLTEGLRTKADISSLNVTAENIRQTVKRLETDTQNKLDQKLNLAEFEVQAGSIRQEILNATKDKADKTLVVAEAGKLREEFSKIQVGGLNHYRDSEKVRTSTRFFPFPLHPYLTQENVGETWTLSFDLKINEGGEIRPLLFYHYQNNRFGLKASANIIPSKEWQRFTFTGPVIFPNDDPRYSRGEMALYDYGGNNNYSVRRIKFEKGTLATDWSPAPEDTDGLITEAKAVFERTAQGLRTDLSAIQEYVNKDGQRQEALQRYTREETARQVNAVRELVTRDYVGKSTLQESIQGVERRLESYSLGISGNLLKNSNDGFRNQHAKSYRLVETLQANQTYTLVTKYWHGEKSTGHTFSDGSGNLRQLTYNRAIDAWMVQFTPKENILQGTELTLSSHPSDGLGNMAWATLVRGHIPLTYWQPAKSDVEEGVTQKLAEYKETIDGRFADITSLISGKANQTDFQHVKETSQLYERTLGNTENGIADKVARMALTNQLFQVEVGKVTRGGRNLIRNYDWNGLLPLQKLGTDWKFERIADKNAKSGYVLKATCTQGGAGGFYKTLFDLRSDEFQGKDMTSSWDMKASRSITFNVMGFEAGGLKRSVPVSTEWTRITNTFKVAFKELFSCVFYSFEWKAGDVVYIRDPQLEEGPIATSPKRALEDTEEAVHSVQSQLAGSWAVQNLTSAGSIVSQINATNNQILIEAEKIRLKGKTLLDELTAIQGYFKRLFVGEGTFATLNADVIRTNSITADKLVMDMAMARRFVSSDLFTDTLAAKEAFINKLRSVVVTATLLEGYRGRIGGFTLGQFDQGGGRWISGVNQFSVGMGNGAGDGVRTAFWANWGNNWNYAGPKAWNVNTDGKMYCRNEVGFYDQVDFSNSSSAQFYGSTYFRYSPRFTSGIHMYDQDILGNGGSPRNSGQNAVVWWNQVGSGSVKYWMDQKSDRRLKENITDTAVKALDKINRLRMVAFDFIESKKHEEIGLIAQEVETIVPRIVSRDPENPDGYLHIDYTALVPYLIKAIQELNQKIEKMEKTIA
ncbi:TPA: tail fiber domain-containing protein [Streptococcus pneumoniae]|nr:tail fiber domain-containing protein [Streptococcus pneumoniae]HET0380441.1 tail fiber domain-containing protein [Streptococcus pneumoniae]